VTSYFDVNFTVNYDIILMSMVLSLWPGALRRGRGRFQYDQAHMARDIHRLPSKAYKQASPETASWLFREWPTYRTGGLRSSFTPLDTKCGTGLNRTAQTHYFTEIFGGRDSGQFQSELKMERSRKYKENGTDPDLLAQTV
jgi:hypothetical protein